MDRNNQIPRDVGAENGSPGGTRLENKGSSCPLCPNPRSASKGRKDFADQTHHSETICLVFVLFWFVFNGEMK